MRKLGLYLLIAAFYVGTYTLLAFLPIVGMQRGGGFFLFPFGKYGIGLLLHLIPVFFLHKLERKEFRILFVLFMILSHAFSIVWMYQSATFDTSEFYGFIKASPMAFAGTLTWYLSSQFLMWAKFFLTEIEETQ